MKPLARIGGLLALLPAAGIADAAAMPAHADASVPSLRRAMELDGALPAPTPP